MLQQRSVKRADLVRELKACLQDPSSHFFADTSFLLAASSLNSVARNELGTWITGITRERFHVPAWVAHEAYGKINSDLAALKPLEKAATEFLNTASLLQTETRRFIDDGSARQFDDRTVTRKDRLGFLAGMDQEIDRLAARAQFLRIQSKGYFENSAEYLVQVINDHVIDSDIYTGLPDVDSEHAARLVGLHPPGFMDKKKDQNRYGDLIIWQEIVRFARTKEIKSVVVCTNDNKQDWVFVPPVIIDDAGRPLNNEAKQGFKVILPLPLLLHEIRVGNPSAKLNILNLTMLAEMLHREVGVSCPNLFAAYQSLPMRGAVISAPPEEGEAEAQAPVEVPQPMPPAAAVQWSDLIRDLTGNDSVTATAAVQAVRDQLASGIALEQLNELGRSVVESASSGVEAASILVRDFVNQQIGNAPAIRVPIFTSMFRALYFDADDGRIRDKPLLGALDDLFFAQTAPDLSGVIDALDAELSTHKRFFLLTPEPSAPRIALTIAGERQPDGSLRLTSILNNEYPLLQDAPQNSPRSLTSCFSGAESATVDELKAVLARYYRVPIAQLETNLLRTQRISWDDLTGFVDWGTRARTFLR